MSMASFTRDGLSFHYREKGAGIPFIFQHGLGADVEQPFSLFEPPTGLRLLAFDCRGHGETRPLGDPNRLGIASFADDLRAFLDHLAIDQAIVGGISMGAAIALNFTLRFPKRVCGLVLSRPAWLDGPTPRNVALFGHVADLIRRHGPARGLELFRQSADYRALRNESPDAAESMLRQFQHPRAAETVAKLERIPADAPCRKLDELRAIVVPTLVLANQQDPIHPFIFGAILARAIGIAGAELHELTPKSVSLERHTMDLQRFVTEFLRQHFAVG
jgi:pimeloyl-ACP methyl ester carboxylesterase